MKAKLNSLLQLFETVRLSSSRVRPNTYTTCNRLTARPGKEHVARRRRRRPRGCVVSRQHGRLHVVLHRTVTPRAGMIVAHATGRGAMQMMVVLMLVVVPRAAAAAAAAAEEEGRRRRPPRITSSVSSAHRWFHWFLRSRYSRRARAYLWGNKDTWFTHAWFTHTVQRTVVMARSFETEDDDKQNDES